MISIDENNNIRVSRYDTFSIRVNLVGEMTLTESDFVQFSIKKTIGSSKIEYSQRVQNVGQQYADFAFRYGDLDALKDSAYVYDISVINAVTEKISTVIWDADFIIEGVAHTNVLGE